MTYQKKLEELILKQHGTILSSDVDAKGIPREYLSLMVSEGSLERTGRGIYVHTDEMEDEMFAMQRKYPKIVYSHETALYVHGLSDRIPLIYDVTVISGYKAAKPLSNKCKIFYIKSDLHQVGILDTQTMFGNPIKIYNIERTVCDLFRSKSRMDIQIFSDALKRVQKNKNIDYGKLMDYARKFHVEIAVRNYLEVTL